MVQSLKKFSRVPYKNSRTGVLRFHVLNCLLTAEGPLTVKQIEEVLRAQGIRHAANTLYQVLGEINQAFTNMELHYTFSYINKKEAQAFTVVIKKNPTRIDV